MRIPLPLPCLLFVACVGVDKPVHVPVHSQLLVVDGGAARLEALNPQTGNYVRYYDVAEGPTQVTISLDGRRAVAASVGDASLCVVNLLDERVERRVPLPGQPRGLAFCDRRSRVVVPLEGSGELAVVRLLAADVERRIDAGLRQPRGVTLSRDKRRAFVPDLATNELVAVDLEAGKVLARVPVGRGPVHALRRARTEEVWVACRDEGVVVVIDGEGLTELARLQVGGAPVGVGFDGDGRVGAVADAAGAALHRLDPQARRVVATVALSTAPVALGEAAPPDAAEPPGDATPAGVLVEPDGRYAFAPLVHADRVAAVDLETDTQVAAFPVGRAPADLAWTWISPFDPRIREGDGDGD